MTKEIKAGNKAIAVFDGWEFTKTESGNWKGVCNGTDRWLISQKEFDSLLTSENGFAYHFDWNKLMPVVEKISQIPYPDSSWDKCEPFENYAWPRTFGMLNKEGKPMVRLQASTLFTADTLIEACWLAVTDFIQWHNQNKPK